MNYLLFTLKKYPFYRLLLPFLLGVVFYNYYPFIFQVIYILVFISFAFIIFAYSKFSKTYHFKWLWGLFVFIELFLFGCWNMQIQRKESEIPYKSVSYFTGIISNIPDTTNRTIRLIIVVDSYCDTNNYWNRCNEKVLVYLQNNDSLCGEINIGDKFLFKTQLKNIADPLNPDEFNYRLYMARQKIFLTAYVKPNLIKLINNNQLAFFHDIPLKIQCFVFNTFRKAGLTNNEFAVISALTVGNKQFLDRETKSSYAAAGAFHLLAVSGLHVGIIFGALSFIFGFLNRRLYGRVIKIILILLFLWIYAAVVGFSSSVTRATLMFSFLY